MQDKLIREKLNSLDSLPEGYAPSLDSKWELLRTGKPEKQKTPLYFWFAAAASLLLLLGFGFVFWQTEKPETVKTLARKETSTEKFSPEIPVQEVIQPASKPENPLIAKTGTAQKNDRVKRPKTVASAQKTAIPAKDSVLAIPVPTQIQEEKAPVLLAENSKATARKKNRYVELDFDAPETPQRLPQPVQTAQLQLKIKLWPQTSDLDRTSAQGQNPLRLQHTF
ncbi:hypothetical protein ACFPIB_12110 [Adhaeribacter terreus]|uniref:Uncharacterized protein n=2 Tax=Adhaeribacter terreus TaxID=529703 RepID=A0ABW0EDV5_9BACT